MKWPCLFVNHARTNSPRLPQNEYVGSSRRVSRPKNHTAWIACGAHPWNKVAAVPHQPSLALDSLQHAKDHLFERRSVVYDHELLTEALRYGRGRVDLGQLRGALEIEKSQGTVVHAGTG